MVETNKYWLIMYKTYFKQSSQIIVLSDTI